MNSYPFRILLLQYSRIKENKEAGVIFNSARPTRVLLKTILTLVVVVTVAATVLLVIGCSSQRASVVSTDEIKRQEQPVLSESIIRDILSYSFSDMSLVRRTAISGEETDKTIEIEVDRPADWGDGTFGGVLSSFVYKTLPPLFQYPEVSRVVVTIYGVDQGIKGDEVACRLMVDRETADKINWSMLGPMSLSYFLTEYYIHPKIQENSKYSGSGIPGY